MTGISDSRFNMWRAVVALVHADNIVTQEERDLVENYFNTVPFTEDQKKVLRVDLEEPRDVGIMFELISSPEDRGDFFSFARLIAQADGNIDEQEEAIYEKLKGLQMGEIGEDKLRAMVKEARKAFDLARLTEDEQFRREAKDLVGLTKIFKMNRGKAA